VRVVLQLGDGTTQMEDTYLDAFAPDGNMQKADTLLMRQGSTAEPLLWFDLASIPQGVSVKSATLGLYVTGRNHAGALVTGITKLARHWAPDYVSWNRSTATDGWAQSGAGGIGYDRLARVYATAEIEGEQVWATWDVSALVQEWVSDAATNYGLLILSQGSAAVEYDLAASEWEVAEYRPYLEIEYDPAQPSPTPAASDTPQPTATPTLTPTGTLPAPTSTPTLTPTPVSARLVLQQGVEGYEGASDTYLDAWQQDGNYGRSRELYVRQGRNEVTLLRYDLSQVPAGARVTEALLSLWVEEADTATEADLNLYELRRAWNADAATWLVADLGVLWSAPGAGAPENDRAVASATAVPLNQTAGWVTIDIADSVQRWVQDPDSNYGLLLEIEGQASPAYRLASSQWDQTAQRPKLVLHYELDGESLHDTNLAMLPWLGGGVVLLLVFYLFSRKRNT